MNNVRYKSVAIVLHWLIAIGVMVMLGTGLYMENIEMTRAGYFKLVQWHKAAGVVVLNMVLLRIIVRLLIKPPALPRTISAFHQRLAGMGHLALYFLIFFIPISGWVMVSSSPFGLPTFVFVDWIKWPHIPFIERNKTLHSIANWAHMLFAYTLIVGIIGHVVAVAYHKRVHELNLLSRMWWSKNK